jgi:hypothetical protein
VRVPSSICLALLLVSGNVGAQPAQASWRSTAKTAVFVELFGNGGLLTYNVDRKLNQRTTARLAYGRYREVSLGDQEPRHFQTLTAMLNALGGGPTWWLEVGVGGRVGTFREPWPRAPSRPLRDITSVVGVRRQPLDGGLVLRVGFTPRYVLRGDYGERGLSLAGGVSVGIAF